MYLNQPSYNNIYYANYRVAIDIKVSSCIFALSKTYGFSSRSRLLYIRVRNKRNQLCQLPRSGWSVDRAGLRTKRPTLPKLYVRKARPKVLIFLRLNDLFEVNQWIKNNVIRQQHLPSYPSIDWTTAAVNVKRPRPSALFCYFICKTGQLTSFATLPYQKTNRYAVVGEIVVRFLSNLAQKSIVSYPEFTYYIWIWDANKLITADIHVRDVALSTTQLLV